MIHDGGARDLAAPSVAAGPGRLRQVLKSRYLPIWGATALLLAISPAVASGSVSPGALAASVPFAAILAIAGIGQTLVIQQRGLDLSVAGMISLSTVLITRYPGGDDTRIPLAILLTLATCALAGLVSGLAVTQLQIAPLVATLGVNALLEGTILAITGGGSTASAPPGLVNFSVGQVSGIPNLVIVAAVLVALTAVAMRTTTIGRRFLLAGANRIAAYVAGMKVRGYEMGAYVIAGIFYGLAGILLAGFVKTPGLSPGDNYLLPSIAAVVLGGTSLLGGSGSVVATAVGAFFLIQLQQVVFGVGAPSSVQLLIQGLVIAAGVALRNVRPSRMLRGLLPVGGDNAARPNRAVEEVAPPHDSGRSAERAPGR